MVKLKLFTTVGVPDNTPELLRLMPVGRVPSVTPKVMVPVPPLAANVWT